jgi:putative transposase
VSRYRCVDAQRAAGFAVAAACKAAGVTRSAYYAWTAGAVQGAAERHQEEARLVAEIRRIHTHSRGTYGARGCMPSLAGAAGAPTTSGSSG